MPHTQDNLQLYKEGHFNIAALHDRLTSFYNHERTYQFSLRQSRMYPVEHSE